MGHTVELGSKAYLAWASQCRTCIMAAKAILNTGTCWRVGNGDSIRVCHDNWLPHHPLKRILQPLPSTDRDMKVSELIDDRPKTN